MKIGIAYLEYSRRKGIERYSAEIAERLARAGHQVHYHFAKCETHPPSNVQLHRVPVVDIANSCRLFSFAVSAKLSLRNKGYDITHSIGNIIGSTVITAQSCHRAALQSLASVPRPPARRRNFHIADQIRLFIEARNFRERRYKKVIAVSEGVKRELMEFYSVPGGDISVIPNGVDLDEFSPDNRLETRARLFADLGLSSDDIVLIFVANEFDRKGLWFLIEALNILKPMNVRLLVAGGDSFEPYRQRARELGVDRQIICVGGVENIARYYKAADAFVFPTLYEAFSLATLEAAASGLPLIVTKVNGTEELVTEGYNGYFIPRDAEAIAHRVQQLFADSPNLSRLRKNARESALRYSWDIIVDKTLGVYKEILA